MPARRRRYGAGWVLAGVLVGALCACAAPKKPIEAPPAHPAQIAPIRRRSWQQIFAAREIEAAREARAREREHERGASAPR